MLIDFYDEGFDYARLTVLACDSKESFGSAQTKDSCTATPTNGWSMMTTEDGLLTNYISALTIDQYDSIWVGGWKVLTSTCGGLLHIVP